MRKLFFSFLTFLIFSINIAIAIPVFFEPIPADEGYIYGKDYEIFSVGIAGSLDETTAKLHIRVEDPTSVWKSVNMSCYLISASTWRCNATVPGLEALVHDGNWLLYFFDAYDSELNYGSLGNETNPLRVRVDRSGPNIVFLMPQNQTYSSGEVEIKINISDTYSGVDPSSAKYSFDNSSWFEMKPIDGNIFVSTEKWNTRSYQNNQSVYIYAKATDKVGNSAYTRIQVLIDNEPPVFSIFDIEINQTIFDVFTFKLNASDKYSGLDFSNIIYKVSNTLNQFSCSGSLYEAECVATFDSKWVNDGKHEAIIKVVDVAGNQVNQSIPIIVDNLPPRITIISPTQATTVSGNVNISAEVRDDGTGISTVKYRIEADGSAQGWKDMYCVSGFCSAIWNSNEVVDGNYLIRVYAEDMLGRSSSLTSYVSVVNAVGIPITTTTTIEKTKKESSKIFLKTSFDFIDKIKKNPILAATFFLPLAFLPVLLFFSLKKPKEKKEINIEEKFEECFTQLEEIRNFINDSLRISDTNQLKDRIRLVMMSLEKLEKEPLKKTVDLISFLGEKKLVEGIENFLKGKEEEIKIIQTQKEEYLQEIFRLLNYSLSEESLENLKRNFEDVNMLIRKLKGLIQREIDILSEGLTEIGYLSKT